MKWIDIPPGEIVELPTRQFVVRVDSSCEFADNLRPDEAKRMGVICGSTTSGAGALVLIGDDTEVKPVTCTVSQT